MKRRTQLWTVSLERQSVPLASHVLRLAGISGENEDYIGRRVRLRNKEFLQGLYDFVVAGVRHHSVRLTGSTQRSELVGVPFHPRCGLGPINIV